MENNFLFSSVFFQKRSANSKGLLDTVRKNADKVNYLVDKWFRDDLPRVSTVIATDFFLGTNIIGLVDQNYFEEANCR